MIKDSSELYKIACSMFDERFYMSGKLEVIHDEIKSGSGCVCDRALSLLRNAQYFLSPIALDSFTDDLEFGYNSGTLESINSPIEQIFFIAFLSILHEKRTRETIGIMIIPMRQESISVDGYDYVPDFLFNIVISDISDKLGLYSDSFMSSVIVECDGRKYHDISNEQISKKNKKTNSLQQSGITVFRFSGSDLFKYPYQCAEEAYCAIIKTFKKDLRNWSETMYFEEQE